MPISVSPSGAGVAPARRSVAPVRAASSAVLAILLGGFFIYGVGFAGPMMIHNAAHDGRHAFAFPCH